MANSRLIHFQVDAGWQRATEANGDNEAGAGPKKNIFFKVEISRNWSELAEGARTATETLTADERRWTQMRGNLTGANGANGGGVKGVLFFEPE